MKYAKKNYMATSILLFSNLNSTRMSTLYSTMKTNGSKQEMLHQFQMCFVVKYLCIEIKITAFYMDPIRNKVLI